MAAEFVEGFALSLQQRQVWTLGHADAHARGVVCGVFRIDGLLPADKMESAVHRATSRHEILRTAIRRSPGMQLPLQVIDEAIAPLFRSVTVGDEKTLLQQLDAEGGLPLDPAAGPLVRVTLFTLAPDRHVLSLTASALVLDGPSLPMLAHELCALAQKGVPVAEDPLQYADFAGWQDDRLGTAEPGLEEARRRWAEMTAVRGVTVPFQREGGERGGVQRIEVPVADVEHIVPGDAPVALLAAWVVLLARSSGLTEIVLGIEGDGRALDDVRDALGPIGKLLPVRVAVSGSDTLVQVAAVARSALAGAAAIEDQLAWPAPGSGDPPLPVRFIVRDSRTAPLGAVRVRLQALDADTTPYAVRLAVTRGDGGVTAEVEFDPARLDPRAAAELAGSLEALIADAAANPGREVSRLSLMTTGQRDRLVALSSGSNAPRPGTSAHDLIAAQAMRTPNATAVLAVDGQLTYAELQTRVGAVAASLGAAGIKPGDVVGFCLGRSVHIPVAMLAILQTGAAFLPLDPSHPEERLAFTLRDAGARALLVAGETARLLGSTGLPTVHLDEPGGRSTGPSTPSTPGETAYIVYTSGTTGTPRGVAVRHAALAHYLPAIGAALDVGPSDVYLQTASVGFSSSVRQVLMPLTRGAAVVVATDEERRDPSALLEMIAARGVTVIDLVPSYLRAVTQVLRSGDAPTRARLLDNRLRLVASASEALHSDLPRAWREFGFGGRLVNMFGLTETTGIVCTYEIGEDLIAEDGVRIVPAGRPLPGLRAYVVDERLALVPAGVTGELLVGGASVENGFVGDAARTRERFVPDPVREGAGTVFRTRDRARVSLDGVLEYLGRTDDLVKVRGVRIELSEVEVALARYPAARGVAAAAHPDRHGEVELVAYIVAQAGVMVEAAAVRQFVATLLPPPMVPTSVVLLDALPLTPNGKLDRRALPSPEDAARPVRVRIAPRDMLEDAVGGLWADVLRTADVSPDDDFFDLGGHSLLATQLVARVRETFRASISLRTLFEAPTVAGMARALRAGEAAPGLSDKVAEVLVRTRPARTVEAPA